VAGWLMAQPVYPNHGLIGPPGHVGYSPNAGIDRRPDPS